MQNSTFNNYGLIFIAQFIYSARFFRVFVLRIVFFFVCDLDLICIYISGFLALFASYSLFKSMTVDFALDIEINRNTM